MVIGLLICPESNRLFDISVERNCNRVFDIYQYDLLGYMSVKIKQSLDYYRSYLCLN